MMPSILDGPVRDQLIAMSDSLCQRARCERDGFWSSWRCLKPTNLADLRFETHHAFKLLRSSIRKTTFKRSCLSPSIPSELSVKCQHEQHIHQVSRSIFTMWCYMCTPYQARVSPTSCHLLVKVSTWRPSTTHQVCASLVQSNAVILHT